MDIVTPVIDFVVDLFIKLIAMIRGIQIAPGVNWWSVMVVLMIISITISLFVRTGKA